MVGGHQTSHDPHQGRYFKPQRLHADKAYDPDLLRWLRWKRIGVRIARTGIESVEEFLLPTLSAVRGGGDAPYLLRLVDTMATQCHRARLLRSGAQPLAFS